jgi:carbon monoxide dehydrogenase subunit G
LDIRNEFVVPLDPSETWKVLLDIKRIMPCVPGAELLDVLDDQTYKGKVSVKLGPVALAFVGTAKFEELDEAGKRAKVLAKGTDAKGRGGANSVVQFRLEPVEDGTKVVVETNLNLSGSVAQYGRASGVIQGVASQLTAQFAQNLKAMLAHQDEDDEQEPTLAVAPAPAAPGFAGSQASVEPEPAVVAASPEAASAAAAARGAIAAVRLPEPAMIIAALARTEAAAARAETAAARVEAGIGRVEAAIARAEATATALRKATRSPALPPPQAKPISGFSLMLTVLREMITGLFSSKKSG